MPKRAIVTLAIGNAFRKIARTTHYFMRLYAEKIEADFIPIHKSIYPHCHFDKFQIYELFNKYERILYLDTDILVTLNCPDLFALVPDSQIGMYNESAPATEQERQIHHQVLEKACKEYGFDTSIIPNRRFYNAGVIVTSRRHKEIFKPAEKVVFMEYGEQPLNNLRIAANKFRVTDIGYRFNRMPYLDEGDRHDQHGAKISPKRTDSHIIHYAGISNVIEEVKKDIECLYPRKEHDFLTIPTRYQMFEHIKITGKDCAEIGVFKGGFSEHILEQDPKNLWMIDPWEHQDASIYPDDSSNVSSNQFEEIYYSLIQKYMTDPRVHIVRNSSFNATRLFENLSFDFIYLDAIHTMESVLLDMAIWFPKIKKGGWLCGHDFTGKFPGVRVAVEAFCKLSKQRISFITMEAAWASWGIQKR